MINKWNDVGASTPTRSTLWDSSWPRLVGGPRRSKLLGYFQNRFGIDLHVFDHLILLERPQAYWLLTHSPHVLKLKKLKVHNTGIPALRKMKDHIKPTTTAIQMVGANATKNVVILEKEQLVRVLTEGNVSLSLPVSRGYVILAYDHHTLGCGLYTGSKLIGQIPRSYISYP